MRCIRDQDCEYVFQCVDTECTHFDLFHMDGLLSFAMLLLLVLVSISLFARVSAGTYKVISGSIKYIVFILILNYNADVVHIK